MKKIIFLFLTLCVTGAFGQQKTYDYAYIHKQSICVYSVAEKKEYPMVTSGNAPCISPDGKKLAYTLMNKGDRFIAIINLTTKKKTILNTYCNNCYGPVWSPDGKYIAYNAIDHTGNGSVAIIDTNNSKPVVLTGKIKEANKPAWCNSGKNIAVQDLHKLYVIDMAGNIVQQFDFSAFNITDGASSTDDFIFTDDNKKVVFSTGIDEPASVPGPCTVIFIYDIATKAIKRLSPKGYDIRQLTVKNNTVFFSGSKPPASAYNSYSINLDGSNFKVLFAGSYDISSRD